MSSLGEKTYQIHRHRDGRMEIVFIPLGGSHPIAVPLSRVEVEIFEILLARIADRIDPTLQAKIIN